MRWEQSNERELCANVCIGQSDLRAIGFYISLFIQSLSHAKPVARNSPCIWKVNFWLHFKRLIFHTRSHRLQMHCIVDSVLMFTYRTGQQLLIIKKAINGRNFVVQNLNYLTVFFTSPLPWVCKLILGFVIYRKILASIFSKISTSFQQVWFWSR